MCRSRPERHADWVQDSSGGGLYPCSSLCRSRGFNHPQPPQRNHRQPVWRRVWPGTGQSARPDQASISSVPKHIHFCLESMQQSMPQQHLTPQLHALHQRLLCFFPHKLQHMGTLDHMAYTLCQGYLRCLSRFNLVSFMISQRLPVLSKARALLKPLSFNAGPGHRFSQQTWRSVMGCQPQHQQQRCSL